MTERREPGDHFVLEMRRVERMLIFWTCAMILASGFLGFVAGRFV